MDDFVAFLDIVRTRLTDHTQCHGLLGQLVELRAALNSDNPFVPECLLRPDYPEAMFWLGASRQIWWRGDVIGMFSWALVIMCCLIPI
jgi:hypothetical protein